MINVFFAPHHNTEQSKPNDSQHAHANELKHSAIVDAGSSLSLISEKFYRTLHSTACASATFKHNNVKLSHAGSGNLKILGATKIELIIRGQSHNNTSASTRMPWHFLVIPNLAADFILGWDFMKYTASVSDAGKLTIYFPRVDLTCRYKITNSPKRKQPNTSTLLLTNNVHIPPHSATIADVEHTNGDAFAHSNRRGVVVGRAADFVHSALFVPQAKCAIKNGQTKILLTNRSNAALELAAERHVADFVPTWDTTMDSDNVTFALHDAYHTTHHTSALTLHIHTSSDNSDDSDNEVPRLVPSDDDSDSTNSELSEGDYVPRADLNEPIDSTSDEGSDGDLAFDTHARQLRQHRHTTKEYAFGSFAGHAQTKPITEPASTPYKISQPPEQPHDRNTKGTPTESEPIRNEQHAANESKTHCKASATPNEAVTAGEYEFKRAQDGDDERTCDDEVERIANLKAQLQKFIGRHHKLTPTDIVDGFHISAKISADQRERGLALLRKYSKRFVDDITDLTPADLPPVYIPTGTEPPVAVPPTRASPKQREAIDRQITKLHKAGIISPTKSAWAHRVVLVDRGPHKDPRVCIDLRKLNEKVRASGNGDNFPMPRLEEIFETLRNSSFYCNLDLRSGYFQQPIADSCKHKTAFATSGIGPNANLWHFNTLPMGYCLASQIFQRAMSWCLRGMHGKALAFQDDICIFASSFDQLLENLEEFFEVAELYNLQLSREKCRFFFTHIRYLGFIISADGISQDPTKLEAIVNYPEPRSTKDCRRFLGLANYYRRHSKGWALHSEDLIKLTRKNAKFEWSNAQREAFYKLKLSLVQHPTLRHPDFKRHFVLVTDASSIAIGAALQQLDDEGDTYTVAYFSRTLNAAQRRWSSYDLEFYAIVASCQRFQDYLRDARFTIISDCASLMTLRRATRGKYARWWEILETFDFDLQHSPGTKIAHADALSREENQHHRHATRISHRYKTLTNSPSSSAAQRDDPVVFEFSPTSQTIPPSPTMKTFARPNKTHTQHFM